MDKHNFSHSQLRRLPAEATYDAVRMAVVHDEAFAKAQQLDVPRALTKPGSSARNQGRDDLSYALSVFGRSVRESNCDCDRSIEPSLLQTVFLVNDTAVQDWLSDPKTSWSIFVANKFGWSQSARSAGETAPARGGANAAQSTKQLESFRQRIDELKQKLAAARESNNDKLVAALEKRQQALIRQAQSTAKKNGLSGSLRDLLQADGQPQLADGKADSENRMTEEQAQWVAENAYLRTLSRVPNAQELATSIGFLKSDEDPVVAVQGLVWSLINTKEFILNH